MQNQHKTSVISTPVAGTYSTATTSSRTFPRHWHGTYCFGVLLDGAHVSVTGRGVAEAHAGQLIASNPGEVHDGRPLGCHSRSWRMIYVETDVLHAAIHSPDEPRGELEVTRPVIDDVSLRDAIFSVFRYLDEAQNKRGTPDGKLAFEEVFTSACGMLVQRYGNRFRAGDHAAPVHMARELLADRCVDPPSLAELAELTGLSRFQLIRRFAAVFGMSPYAWLLRHRAERARCLIQSGRELVDTAITCGFADQGHMTRTFVQQFGFTPGALRRALKTH